jgi:hypothetical protein
LTTTVAGWDYNDHVPEARRIALASAGSFPALLEQVVADVSNVRVRVEPGRAKGLTHCIQPLFTLDLPKTGDALFNGPFGYRAQYWLGPEQGLAANATLLAGLAPRLLGALATSTDHDLSRIDVCAAITAASAKVWIRESLSLIAPTADLSVGRWADNARKGIELAKLGLMAPEITKFEVKGALIDPYGHEAVPAEKIRRHYQIHHYGFS